MEKAAVLAEVAEAKLAEAAQLEETERTELPVDKVTALRELAELYRSAADAMRLVEEEEVRVHEREGW